MAFTLDENIKKIIDFYGFEGELLECKAFGNGHINDTILLDYGTGKQFVLQKINKFVFHHPDELMANMKGVTEHLKKKVIAAGGNPDREVLTVVPAANGDIFYIDDKEDYWRITKLITGAKSYDIVEKPEDFYITGKAFGHFQNQLSDYPADTLYETIPGFHDTRARYNNFIKSVEADVAGRCKDVQDEIKFILDRKELAYYSMDSFDKGELPLRVTHNDTKINNLMIDDITHEAICVLDLDTVMPGFAMMDFG
ncbi:MAG: aminoglycoside phosphotransferase family protein, partial [Bacillota bacterium]|nr:aminoglycoside phosphotransferase family protein [Bacillota bacterium]